MLKKICPKCNEIIDIGSRYCETCSKKYLKQKHKVYDDARKDDIYYAFYKSLGWKRRRSEVLSKYHYIDLYQLHVNKKIVTANTVHHIIELRVDWDKRLDMDNLFPCSSRTHNMIEKLYRRDREGTQMLLRKLLRKGVGG